MWLNAILSAPLGLNLDNNALRIAIGLRLGVPLVMPHQCPCGAAVDKLGHHGLACKRSAGRHLRHNLLNDGILRALQSAGVQAVREPPGLDCAPMERHLSPGLRVITCFGMRKAPTHWHIHTS